MKRVLTIQDISCLGQCSLTVALPVISACGAETCILPSALLSTHTMGFDGYTFLDLSDEMKRILSHWDRLGIKFDAIYTGYLGDIGQIDIVEAAFGSRLSDGGLKTVDPVMGDFGRLYPAFDGEFVKAMRRLCAGADIILPNITEACLLLNEQYREDYDEEYILGLLNGLHKLGAKNVVLTGVGFQPDSTGVAVYDGNGFFHYPHPRLNRSCHGTGDVFASVFTGALMKGRSVRKAAVLAADFILECIGNTPSEHWYGVNFETCLPTLCEKLRDS